MIESGLTNAEFEVVDALTHSDAPAAIRFWDNRPQDGIRIGRDVPSRAIAGLLSRVAVYEPIRDGADFRVHLAGSTLRRRFSRDITGETLSSLYNAADLPPRLKTMQDIMRDGEPRLLRIVHRASSVEILRIELLQIPVVAPNGIDPWIMVFALYF
jgi:PAS domain.